MLKKLALELSKDGSRSYETNLYLLRNNLIMLGTLLLILLLGYIFGIFKWTAINVFTVMIFRGFSGGSHSKSKITCTVISLIVPILFATLIEYKLQYIFPYVSFLISLVIFIIGVILVNKYAPADTPQKPIISQKFKKQLKFNAYIFLSSIQVYIVFLYIVNNKSFSGITFSFILGLMWQLITITPWGYHLVATIDKVLSK